MKGIYIKLMAIISVLALTLGCEAGRFSPNIKRDTETLMVAAPTASPDTKVSLTPNSGLGYQVAWEVGDKLLVSTANGRTHVARFEIKSGDIAADGSAEFTKISGTALSASAKYHFHFDNVSTNQSYNSYKAGITPIEVESAVSNKDDRAYVGLYSAAAQTVASPILLTHAYTFLQINLTLKNAPTGSTFVKVTYNGNNKTYKVEQGGTAVSGKEISFTAAVEPANSTIVVEIKESGENSFTEIFRSTDSKALAAGKHYSITAETPAPADWMLTDFSGWNYPDGDTWIIGDTDATARYDAHFVNLKSAISGAGGSLNIIFSELKTFPDKAFFLFQPTTTWSVRADKVKEVKDDAFFGSTAITSINLPNATKFGEWSFATNNECSITIAKYARVETTPSRMLGSYLNWAEITLITDPRNANYNRFVLADGTEIGPFKSVNGITTDPPVTP